jgi:ubiquinone/menaquinone biosynthesis C-methylase UbiE
VKRRVAELFSRLAPGYGSVINFFDYFGAKLVELAGVKPGMRVLDVCAGRGASARPALALGAGVVAVDLADGMVESLRAQGLDARVMDAENLDFGADEFDAVLCGFGLFFCPDPVAAARGFHRVVRPGGPVACSMPLNVFPPHVLELRQEFTARSPAPAMPGPRPDFDGAGVLKAAGFAEVEVVEEATEYTLDSAEDVWEFVLATGAREMYERLGPDDQAELRDRVIAGCPDGPVALPMSARFWLTSG